MKLNRKTCEKIDGKQCLSIFPAEFANAADLGDGEQLLGAGRAETMKEVYDILERRHADNTRAQAEAAHRAKMESMTLERLESQKKAEEYARKQAEYARTQAEYAKDQADSMKRLAQESEKQTAYARAQADCAERIQSDIDTMMRS